MVGTVTVNQSQFPVLATLASTIGSTAIPVSELKPGVCREIQAILKALGLYDGEVDGMTGAKTSRAIARFKEERWLGQINLVGVNTIDSLLEGKHPVSEQSGILSATPYLIPQEELGIAKGTQMMLPNGQCVHAQQLILSPIPLTWGEFTKDCTRIPLSNQVCQSAVNFAKAYGWVRDKWGKPIRINSGYRPPQVNAAIGGASRSRHMSGDAGDICPYNGNIYDLLAVVKASPFTGIGLGMHRGFIHCDARPGGRVVFSY